MKAYCSLVLNKWCLLLVALTLLPTFSVHFHSSHFQIFLMNYAQAAQVTKERYNDFYDRKTRLKREDEAREEGRLKYKESKKKQIAESEAIEAKFAKAKKEINQEKQDKIAEEWMQKQDRLHEESLMNAREKYKSSKKDSLKYRIPEYEEYEVK